MNKRLLMIFLIATFTVTAVFAGTPFEDDHKTYDPYLADTMGGFDSLFVNPAGLAGQTQIFSFAVEGGGFGHLEDIEKLQEWYELYESMESGDPSTADAEVMAELLNDNLSQSDYATLIQGTTAPNDMSSPTFEEDLALWLADPNNDDEKKTIASNYEQFGINALDDIEFQIAWEMRAGVLIGGIAGGLYYRQSMPFNAGYAGFNYIVSEAGLIGGAGFNVGAFALGASLNYGYYFTHGPMTLEEYNNDFENQPMWYGYAWGLDAGVIWSPLDSLHFGVVFNDIIGSTIEDAGVTTMKEFRDGSYTEDVDITYEFDIDMDAGITWQPDWRIFSPKLAFEYYDIIGLARFIDDNPDLEDKDYWKEALGHMRIGANVRLLGFLDLGVQYYDHFYSVGAGVDILLVQIYLEVMFDDYAVWEDDNDVSQVGAVLMVKFHL